MNSSSVSTALKYPANVHPYRDNFKVYGSAVFCSAHKKMILFPLYYCLKNWRVNQKMPNQKKNPADRGSTGLFAAIN